MTDVAWLVRARTYASKAVFIALSIFLHLFFIRFFIIDYGVVSGPSMSPKFQDGEYFFVLKLPLFFRAPRRFETVQLIDPSDPNTVFIKRIIGLPGETVAFRQNGVCVSGPGDVAEACLAEPYLDPDAITRSRADYFETYTVPPDTYYALGDNRTISEDSRDFGTVPRSLILGVAVPVSL